MHTIHKDPLPRMFPAKRLITLLRLDPRLKLYIYDINSIHHIHIICLPFYKKSRPSYFRIILGKYFSLNGKLVDTNDSDFLHPHLFRKYLRFLYGMNVETLPRII